MATNPASAFADGDTKVLNGHTYVRQGGVWTLQGGGDAGGLDIVTPKLPAPQTKAQADKDVTDAHNATLTGQNLQLEIDNKDPVLKAQKGARSVLAAAGVDLQKGIDPVTDLIKNSTSGRAEHYGAEVKGAVTGEATPGMVNIGKLQTLASTLTLQLMNGSLGTGISNADRDFITQQVGDIANPNIPANQRLGAWQQVLSRMGSLTGVEYHAPTNTADDQTTSGTNVMGFFDEKHDPINPMSPDQQKAYDAFFKANPKATPDQLSAFATAMGVHLGNAKEIIDARNAGKGVAPGGEAQFGKPDLTGVRGTGKTLEAVDAGVRSAANVVPLADEISAAARTIFGDGTYKDNLNWERAVDEYDWKHHFPSVVIGTVAGAMAIPSKAKAAGQAASAETLAAGGTAAQAASAAKAAFVRRMTLESGAYGAASGVGSEGDLGERLEKGVVGGVTGAVTGALGAKMFGPGKPKPVASNTGPSAAEVGGALQAEGIPAARPVADPTVRGKMSYLETTRGGHGPVRESLEETRASIADKVEGLKGAGEAQTPGGMGEDIQQAGNRRLSAQKRLARRVYDKAADESAGVTVTPSEAVTTLDGHIARLERNPNANRGTLSYLKSVRGDLVEGTAPKPKTVADIRDIRTGLNDEINRRNLGRTRAEAIMEDVLGAARRDVQRDLGRANPDALNTYKQADDMWSAMSKDRKQIVEGLIGPADNPLSGEKAMAKVRNMMGNRGDMKRFERVMNMMTPKQREDFAATLFEGVGQKSPEEPFSPAVFLGNTRDMQPEALEKVFGAEGRKSVMNLRVAARAFTDTQGALNNSRSGFVANFKDVVSSIVNLRSTGGGAIGFALGGPVGAVGGAVAGEASKFVSNRLSAKALMNTEVSQWIRAASKAKTEKEARGLIGKLGTVASRNPQISQELTGLRGYLTNAVNDNFGLARSAASGTGTDADSQQ